MRSFSVATSRQLSQQKLPASISPMLAVSSELPVDQKHYTFEYKWDGVRAMSYWDGSRLKIESRNLLDITRRYPELHALGIAIGKKSAVLDGEIVSMDDTGRPSFARLQHRMHLNNAQDIARLSKKEPVYYILFDVLFFDGQSTMDLSQQQRREILESLSLSDEHWQITPSHIGKGSSMLKAARENQLEGLVAKRLDSLYEPGRRSPMWKKIKIVNRQEFVVGGWVPERTGAAERIGAILVGYYEEGQLHFAGKVGTGLSAADHSPLLKKLGKSIRENPFAERVPGGAHFVSPKTVVEIDYRRWPAGGSIQHASYKGIRTDKSAKDVGTIS